MRAVSFILGQTVSKEVFSAAIRSLSAIKSRAENGIE